MKSNVLILVLLPLLFVTNCAAQHGDHGHEDLAPGYHLDRSVENGNLVFSISVNHTTGYIGFGLNAKAGVMDEAILTFTSQNATEPTSGYLMVMRGAGHSPQPLGNNHTWTMSGFSQVNGITKFTLKTPVTSNHANHVNLENGGAHVLWALGPADIMYHGTQRGTKHVKLVNNGNNNGNGMQLIPSIWVLSLSAFGLFKFLHL